MKRASLFCAGVIMVAGIFLATEKEASAGCTAGVTDVLDNDNHAIDSRDNDYVGPWKYESGSTSFRGDHRYLAIIASTSLYEYNWRFPSCKGLYANVYAYVWNTKFTNRLAMYQVHHYPGGTELPSRTMSVTFNQRNAPGGWNYVGKTTEAKTGVVVLAVTNRQEPGTGADGVKVTYSTK